MKWMHDFSFEKGYINEDIQKMLDGISQKLYGPRHCDNCGKVQPVITYKRAGSDFTKYKDYELTLGFTGAYVCSVCYKNIGSNNE